MSNYLSEELLIELVKKYECIYNKKSISYRNVKEKEKAWAAISMEIQEEEKVCKTRWRSIRDRYVREYAKLQLPSGSETNFEKCNWPLFSSLSFLREFVMPKKTSTSVPQNQYENENESFVVESWDESAQHIPIEAPDICSTSSSTSALLSPSGEGSNSCKSHSTPLKMQNTTEVRFATFLGKVEDIVEKRFRPEDSDKHETFCKLVSSKLNELPDDVQEESKMTILNFLRETVKDFKNLNK